MPFSPDSRLAALAHWLRNDLRCDPKALVPASGDASFRRYFRVTCEGASLIAMDAPPRTEDTKPFVQVAELLKQAGLHVPDVLAVDPVQGFLLLSDLGSRRYQDVLTAENADRLYGDAMDALVRFQGRIDIARCRRPPYDEALLRRELQLFRDWFLERLLGLELGDNAEALLKSIWNQLVTSALEQPKVFVHRDYHSRNLMFTAENNPGILDFQDAVVGPLTYDLVSLLRDCYVNWPEARVRGWMDQYRIRAGSAKVGGCEDGERFQRWFDLMGMQRHLKAIGIFSRLRLRDDKPHYLNDIPRTLGYVAAVARRYRELAGFARFLDEDVFSRLAEGVPA